MPGTAAFFDRDGTISVEKHYLYRLEVTAVELRFPAIGRLLVAIVQRTTRK